MDEAVRRAVEDLTIGALLHDVGKVVRRAKKASGVENVRNHRDEGADFLERIGFSNFSDYARFHHHPEYESAANFLITFVHYGDVLSASERKEMEEDSWNEFSCFNLAPTKAIFTPFPLKKGEFIFPSDQCKEDDVKNGYRIIYEELENELKNIARNINPNSVLSIIEKTLFFVPSETNVGKDRTPDISLYAHLKSTAMLASSLYVYAVDKKGGKLSVDDVREILENDEPFLLVKGEFSGIQKYIYNVSSKWALKSLRARSFFLEIMTSVIADDIVTNLGFFWANVLYTGGGGLIVVLPNTDNVKDFLKEESKKINEWLFENEHEITFVMEWKSFGKKHLESGVEYAKLFKELTAAINERKLHPYDKELLFKVFQKEVYGRGQCSICGKRPEKLVNYYDVNICESCKKFLEIGSKLQDARYVYETFSKGDIDILGRKFAVGKDLPNAAIGVVFDLEGYGDPISTSLPSGIYAKNKMIETLFEEEESTKYIGVFRADVDSLGETFRKLGVSKDQQVSKSSFSRITTLSSALTLFFKLYVPAVCSGKIKGTTVPKLLRKQGDKEGRGVIVIYAGGDDLFIIGRWDDVVATAVDINKAFERFTMGGLSMSGGVVLAKQKTELFKLSGLSAEAEDKAKGFEKDGIKKNAVAFGHIQGFEATRWKDLEKLLNDFLEAFVGEDDGKVKVKVSRSFLRKVMALQKEAMGGGKTYIPKYLYHLVRNVKDEDTFRKLESLYTSLENPVSGVVLGMIDLIAREG